MIDNMLVKVCVEQGLQREHSITHGALIDHPGRQKKNNVFTKAKKTLSFL